MVSVATQPWRSSGTEKNLDPMMVPELQVLFDGQSSAEWILFAARHVGETCQQYAVG